MGAAEDPEIIPLWEGRALFAVNVAALFFLADVLMPIFVYISANPLALVLSVGAVGVFALVIVPAFYSCIKDFIGRVAGYSHYIIAGGFIISIGAAAMALDANAFAPINLTAAFARNTVLSEFVVAALLLFAGGIRRVVAGEKAGAGDIYEP